MKPFGNFGIAVLLATTMSTSAFATSGDEAETIIKDNTYNSATAAAAAVNNTHVGVQTGAAAHNNTHVGVQTGDNTLNNSTELENTNNLNNQNHLTTGNNTNDNRLNNQNNVNAEGGNAYAEGGQGGNSEQEQGQEQGQSQTANAVNGGQNNSQNTSYSSTYKAAAAGARAYAPTVIPSSKCGSASSWGFGAQVIGGGLSLSGGSSDPAGVQIRYINDDGKEAVASLKSYATGTDVYKAEVTDKLSGDKRDQVECLAGEFNNREDGQQHQKEMAVMGAHVTRVENASAHACRPDAKHVGHDCIEMGDTSLDSLNQMIGFEPTPVVKPTHDHN
ncbi:MAG: hypothetical protein JKY11_08210 [Alphaproteobacteria bacterium]|nr:hypothetical protein [Alphaproteobacteria bacterium]